MSRPVFPENLQNISAINSKNQLSTQSLNDILGAQPFGQIVFRLGVSVEDVSG